MAQSEPLSPREELKQTVAFLLSRDFGFRKAGAAEVVLDRTEANNAFWKLLPPQHRKESHLNVDGALVGVRLISEEAEKIRKTYAVEIAKGTKKADKAFKTTAARIEEDFGLTETLRTELEAHMAQIEGEDA